MGYPYGTIVQLLFLTGQHLGVVPLPMTPEQFDARIRDVIASNAALVRAPEIRLECPPKTGHVEAAERWRRSPFYRMLQTGDSLLRRRLSSTTKEEFAWLPDYLAAGMTDYVAIITRFAAGGVIGEMDGVYTSGRRGRPTGSMTTTSRRLRESRRTSRLPSNRYRSRA
jgi:hypothetical protein